MGAALLRASGLAVVALVLAIVLVAATACGGSRTHRVGSITRKVTFTPREQMYGRYVETIKVPGTPTSASVHWQSWGAARVPMSPGSACVTDGLRATWTLVGHTAIFTFLDGDRYCGPTGGPHRLRLTVTYG